MRFLIFFDAHAMDDIPQDEMIDVATAAHTFCQEAIDAGVYVASGGLPTEPSRIVHPDGSLSEGQLPDVIGGFTIIDVSSQDDALAWAARVAVACRCSQEVRKIGVDPQLEEMLEIAAGRRSE